MHAARTGGPKSIDGESPCHKQKIISQLPNFRCSRICLVPIFHLAPPERWSELVETFRTWSPPIGWPGSHTSLATATFQGCEAGKVYRSCGSFPHWIAHFYVIERSWLWCLWSGIVDSSLEEMYNPHLLWQWDLGEFNQKGTVQTRWGTREEYLQACKVAQEYGIDILVDAVLNVCHSSRFSESQSISKLQCTTA